MKTNRILYVLSHIRLCWRFGGDLWRFRFDWRLYMAWGTRKSDGIYGNYWGWMRIESWLDVWKVWPKICTEYLSWRSVGRRQEESRRYGKKARGIFALWKQFPELSYCYWQLAVTSWRNIIDILEIKKSDLGNNRIWYGLSHNRLYWGIVQRFEVYLWQEDISEKGSFWGMEYVTISIYRILPCWRQKPSPDLLYIYWRSQRMKTWPKYYTREKMWGVSRSREESSQLFSYCCRLL